MQTAKQVITRIASLVSDSLGDAIKVKMEFSGTKQPLPLEHIYVSFGVNKTDLTATDNTSLSGSMTIEALICAPKSFSGLALVDVMDRILTTVLSTNASGYKLIGFSSDPVKYSTTFSMLTLPVYITVEFGAAKS